MKKARGTLPLLLTAMIWGLAFVAQTSAAGNIGSFSFNAARSIIAAICLLVLNSFRKISGKSSTAPAPAIDRHRLLRGGLLCGAALCLASNFQQFGIAAYPEGVAASGRAGFLTATYVVMTALCAVVAGKKPHPLVLAGGVLCIGGMYLLCAPKGMSGLYLGDVLELICAVCFTAQILLVSKYADLDGVSLSCVQFAVCGALSLIGALIFEDTRLSDLADAWMPVIYAGVFSSGIGYTLQIIGQKYAEPAVASIIMSLESVFAALAGWLILHERLGGQELLGCALVFIAVLLAQTPELLRRRA